MKTEAETGVTQLGTLRITGSSQELGESPGGQLSPSEFLEESMEDQLAPLTPSFWTSEATIWTQCIKRRLIMDLDGGHDSWG